MHLATVVGAVCAFIFSAATVLYDFHTAIKAELGRVRVPVIRLPWAWVFCALFGGLAVAYYILVPATKVSLSSSLLTVALPNDILRGVFVGLLILVMVRSKITTVQGKELGLEGVYLSCRSLVLEQEVSYWRNVRSRWLERASPRALTIVEYDAFIAKAIEDAVSDCAPEFAKRALKSLETLKKRRPRTPFDVTNHEWLVYYSTLSGLALDYGGLRCLQSAFSLARPGLPKWPESGGHQRNG